MAVKGLRSNKKKSGFPVRQKEKKSQRSIIYPGKEKNYEYTVSLCIYMYTYIHIDIYIYTQIMCKGRLPIVAGDLGKWGKEGWQPQQKSLLLPFLHRKSWGKVPGEV